MDSNKTDRKDSTNQEQSIDSFIDKKNEENKVLRKLLKALENDQKDKQHTINKS